MKRVFINFILLFFSGFLAAAEVPVFTSTVVPSSGTLEGNVFRVAALRDQSYAFAPLSWTDFTLNGESIKGGVIAVFKKDGSSWSLQHYIPVNYLSTNIGQAAYGLALTPDESVMAVALNNKGIGLLDVQDVIAGAATPYYIGSVTGTYVSPGAIGVAATNDYVFVADEYGKPISGVSGTGDISVVAIQRDTSGKLSGGTRLGFIVPGQNSIPSLSLSPDGKTLYVPNQAATKAVHDTFKETDESNLNGYCPATQTTQWNGSISVIDVDKAIQLATAEPTSDTKNLSAAILHHVSAGCNPVRIAPSSDGKKIYVTARAENKIHVYDANSIRNNPDASYLYSFDSGGSAPVGIATFGEGKYVAVSNSDRFADEADQKPSIAIFDVSTNNSATLVTTIETGLFPRDIFTVHGEKSVLVANYTAKTFQEISYRTVQSQSITLTPISDKLLGEPPFSITASGGASGNPVEISSVDSSVCTVDANKLVTLVSAGDCTLTATQQGNEEYAAAESVTLSFAIGNPTASGTQLTVASGIGGSIATGDSGDWEFASNSPGFIGTNSLPTLPVGSYTFPYEAFSFVLVNGAAGSQATVNLDLPEAAPNDAVLFKYGRQQPGGELGWYQIASSFSTDRKRVSFTVSDGAGPTGDDDQIANSVIIDPVLLAIPSAAQAVPSLSEWAKMLLVIAMICVTGWRLRLPLNGGRQN